jgi:parallel beta-helix repeat protein
MNFKVLISVVLAATIAVVGCSDDNGDGGTGGTAGTGGTGGTGGTAGTGGTGGTPPTVDCNDLPAVDVYAVAEVFDNVPVTPSDDCTDPIFALGADAAARLNTRIENADPGDVICLAEGTYEMDTTINVSLVGDLTIKGIGDSPDDTVLNFGGPGSGIGIFVQQDDVTVENLWVKNTGANGIEQDGTSGSIFRKVHVSWENENQEENGAYGIYPTNCEDTLVEYSQATDAADAGIYIGKCGWLDDETTGGIVRYNIAANNVAGLEVENCLDVVAHDNYVIGNTGGLMPLQQPISADRPANTGVLLENNRVYCNNGENFATTGVVQIIPVGTGLLNLGGQGVEIRNNDVQGNDTLGLAIVSSSFTCDAAGADCPPYSYDYNPYAQDIYAHDNYFLNNGTNADTESEFYLIFDLLNVGTPEAPTPDVIWDGNIAPPGTEDPGICLGTDFAGTYRDLTNNQCQMPANAAVFAACIVDNNTASTANRLCDL